MLTALGFYPKREGVKIIGKAVEIRQSKRITATGSADATLCTAAHGAAHVALGRKHAAAGQHETAETCAALGVETVYGIFQILYVVAIRHIFNRLGAGHVCTDGKEQMLGAAQRSGNAVAAVGGPFAHLRQEQADVAVQFIERANRLYARRTLVCARAVGKGRAPLVAAARVKFCHLIIVDDIILLVKPLFKKGNAEIVKVERDAHGFLPDKILPSLASLAVNAARHEDKSIAALP